MKMLGAGPFLVAVVVVFSSGASAYPGMIDAGSTLSTSLTSIKTGPLHVITTVYETVCNETLTSSRSSASSRTLSLSSYHGNSTTVSTKDESAHFPSHAQSATSYQSSDYHTPSTRSINDSPSNTLGAQSASNSSSSAQSSNPGSSARQTSSHSSRDWSSSSSSSTSTSESFTGQTVMIQSATSRNSQTTSSEPSTFTTRSALSSSSRYSATGQNSSSHSSPSTSRTSLSASINEMSVSHVSPPTASTILPSSVLSNSTLAVSTAASTILPSSVLSNSTLAVSTAASKNSSSGPSAALSASKASIASVLSASRIAASETATAANCNDGSWDLTITNYLKANTDANLKTWWNGGTDNETGVTFPAKSAPGTFLTEALAASFEPVGSQLVCTLESHSCQPADGCTNYAVHVPQGTKQLGPASFFKDVGPASHYGWFAVHSIANIFSFSESFTAGLTSAGIQIASENMQLTETFTKPVDQEIKTRGILYGLALLIAILFTFVPVIGEVMDAALTAGIIAGAAFVASYAIGGSATFIGLSLANGASLDTKAETFGAYMALTFNRTAGAIDQLVTKLMNGEALNAPQDPATPSLFNILSGGLWINSSVITNPKLSISAMTELMRDDLTSRGINYIWLQSKIYVTFANLNDDAAGTKCHADKNGWQASKSCADGGVYYLYRFNEDGNLVGHLDYPWGADKMTDSPFNLQPNWVTAGSAASYRAQNGGLGGFEYDQTAAPGNLTNLLTQVAKTGTLDGLRTMPGVWNLSVCDMGLHNDWNADFTQKPIVTENKDNLDFFFPCCCGPNCLQTHDFVQSAQMENFKTIFYSCRRQMQPCKAWPPGVVSIDFGDAGVITNDSCINEDHVPPEPAMDFGPF